MLRTLAGLLCGLGLFASAVAATAQDFPGRPVRLIVPFAAGGPNDTIARVVGQRS
jgi:tripartite-type tricarboxylate transporter receptor subunit TctC